MENSTACLNLPEKRGALRLVILSRNTTKGYLVAQYKRILLQCDKELKNKIVRRNILRTALISHITTQTLAPSHLFRLLYSVLKQIVNKNVSSRRKKGRCDSIWHITVLTSRDNLCFISKSHTSPLPHQCASTQLITTLLLQGTVSHLELAASIRLSLKFNELKRMDNAISGVGGSAILWRMWIGPVFRLKREQQKLSGKKSMKLFLAPGPSLSKAK